MLEDPFSGPGSPWLRITPAGFQTNRWKEDVRTPEASEKAQNCLLARNLEDYYV